MALNRKGKSKKQKKSEEESDNEQKTTKKPTKKTVKKGKSSQIDNDDSDLDWEFVDESEEEEVVEEVEPEAEEEEEAEENNNNSKKRKSSSKKEKKETKEKKLKKTTSKRKEPTKRGSKKIKEKKEYDGIEDEKLVDYRWAVSRSDPPQQLSPAIRMLPFQLESLKWMTLQEENEQVRGGILADDMGMGKTLQAIAMILKRKEMTNGIESSNADDNNNNNNSTAVTTTSSESMESPAVVSRSNNSESGTRQATLVICPVVALNQWNTEIQRFTKENALKVSIYHGSSRETSADDLLDNDVVLTSYAIVECEYRHEKKGRTVKGEVVKKKSLLHSLSWNRVILDEAHSIKDRSCSTAKSVFNLNAQYRWALTGTPLQNRVSELFSQIKFLRMTPYSYYYCKKCDCKSLEWKFANNKTCDSCGCSRMSHIAWWNKNVMNPIIRNGIGSEKSDPAMKTLKYILQRVMLRRTKEEKKEDLCLPPRLIYVRRDEFDDEENDFYDALYTQTKTTFNNFVEEGTILSNYAHVFDLLLRLRQAVDHPYLVLHSRDRDDDKGTDWCGLCNEPAEDPIQAKCKHVFCRSCMESYVEMPSRASGCPVCRAVLTIDLTSTYVPPTTETVKSSKSNTKTILQRVDLTNWRSSTKLEAVLEELTKIREKDPCAKTIIFSQFVNYLDLIDWRLKLAGFGCVKLDGRMTLQQKSTAIDLFNNHPGTTVFLISLKAGGVALNLTIASYCFLLDPWWNPAAEFQAIDRLYRLGQFKCVRVIRFIVSNTIEDRIIALQEKKHLLFNSTIGMDQESLARLSLEDLKFLFI